MLDCSTGESYTTFMVGSHQVTQSLPPTHCIQKQLIFQGLDTKYGTPTLAHNPAFNSCSLKMQAASSSETYYISTILHATTY
jgi:hypothetical protein